ncbi:hypothetical protein PTTG_30978, partial [Puccinia triticina 1-1 BBBD Race 1]
HIEDHIYNHVITDENENDAFAIWKELKGEYASSSVLAIYHVWRKWEDIQYKEDINSYVTKLEETLAEFAAMGLDIPPTILSCTIIAQISRKRPSLMQTLISNADQLSQPRLIIAKLRDIAHHDAVEATMQRDTTISEGSSTALTTQAMAFNSGNNQKKRRWVNPHPCREGKHNPLSGHSADDCWTLHPSKFKKTKQAQPPTGFITTAQQDTEPS